jgi:hypothetical protein
VSVSAISTVSPVSSRQEADFANPGVVYGPVAWLSSLGKSARRNARQLLVEKTSKEREHSVAVQDISSS